MIRNSRKLLAGSIVFVLVTIGLPIAAQTSQNYYNFASTTTTDSIFTSIRDTGTVVDLDDSTRLDNGRFDPIPIPFKFYLFGQRVTTLVPTTNLWLTTNTNYQCADTSGRCWTPNEANAGGSSAGNSNNNEGGIYPYWLNTAYLDGNSRVLYETDGEVGSRTLTIEFSRFSNLNTSDTASLSLQVKLYEGNSQIDFIYEKLDTGSTVSRAIGLAASDTFLTDSTTPRYYFITEQTQPPTASADFNSLLTTDEPIIPDTGRVYRFTPDLYLPPAEDISTRLNTNISVVLPPAMFVNGTVTYALTGSAEDGSLPSIFNFNATTRTLSGVSANPIDAETLTYSATDDDNVAVTRTFTLTVADTVTNTTTAFATGDDIRDISVIVGNAIERTTLPAPNAGNAPFTYSFSPDLPTGLSFEQRDRMLEGTPTTVQSTTTYTYTATDIDGEGANLEFTITVLTLQPIAPMAFDYRFSLGESVDETLPKFTSGNGALTYALEQTPSLPIGLSFNAQTRVLSGTITEDMVEDDSFSQTYTYTATDEDGDSTAHTFTITIVDQLPDFGAQVVSPISLRQHISLAPITLPAAFGGTGELTYSLAPTLPAGLEFNADNRTLSGTPRSSRTATTYTYSATDAVGDSDSLTFTITVTEDLMPSFLPNADQTYILTPGQAITNAEFPELDSDGDNPGPAVITPSTLPHSWISLSGRTFSGNAPTDDEEDNSVAPFAITQTFTDEDGDVASVTFTFEVVDAIPVPPVIPNYTFQVGQLIDPIVLPAFASTADDYPDVASPTLTHNLGRRNGQALGNGLMFDSQSRRLTGTPNTTGRIMANYRAADTDSGEDGNFVHFDIFVVDATTPVAPAIPNAGFVFNPGETVSETLPVFTGGTAPLTYSLMADGSTQTILIGGLTFDPDNRMISGTLPADTAIDNSVPATTYTYTATDSATPTPNVGSTTFTIAIVDERPVFSIAEVQDISVKQNSTMAPVTLPAATGGRGILLYSLTPQPPERLRFNSEERLLSGTPATSQSATTYTYTVTDEDGDTDTLTFTITVPPNSVPRYSSNANQTHILTPGQTLSNVNFPDLVMSGDGTPSPTVIPNPDPSGTFTDPWDWLTLETTNNVMFSGVVPADMDGDSSAGPFRVTRTETDDFGDTASVTFTFQVIDSMPTIPEEPIPNYDVSANQAMQPIVLPVFETTVDDIEGVTSPTLTYTLTAQGGGGALPSGLSFDATTRTLTGTPDPTGTTTLIYAASDGQDTASVTFDIVVVDDSSPIPPIIDNGGYMFGNGEMVEQILPAFTLPGDLTPNLTYSLRNTTGEISLTNLIVGGLGFTSATRLISGTVNIVDRAGDDSVEATYTYSATDDDATDPDTVSTTFTIAIEDDFPSFGNAMRGDISGTRLRSIEPVQFPVATGGRGILTYSLLQFGNPFAETAEGLDFDSETRTLSGAPGSSYDDFPLQFRATDEDGDSVELDYSITVTSNVIPVYSLDDLSPAIDQTFTRLPGSDNIDVTLPTLATEGTRPHGLEATSGLDSLPSWLTHNNGIITVMAPPETPIDDSVGPYAITRSVTDGNGDMASVTFTFEVVDPVPMRPTIPNYEVSLNQAIQAIALPPFATALDDNPRLDSPTLTYSLTAQGEDGNSVTLSEPFSSWLRYDEGTRTLTGTPDAAGDIGTTTLTYSAADGPDSDSVTFDIVVADDPRPIVPVIPNGGYTFDIGTSTTETLPAFTGGNEELTYTLTALDSDGDALNSLPAWLTFDGPSQVITFTSPTDTTEDDSVAATTYTYSATDSDTTDPDTVSTTFTIAIEDDIPSFVSTVDDFSARTDLPLRRTLPQATGGTGDIRYTLRHSQSFVLGLDFDRDDRVLFGTPSINHPVASQLATTVTYTAIDSVDDSVSMTFSITVSRQLVPAFPGNSDRTIILAPEQTISNVRFPNPSNRGNSPRNPVITPALDAFPVDWLMLLSSDMRTFTGVTPADTEADDSVDPFTITQTISDADDEEASVTFTFEVVDPVPIAPTIGDYNFVINRPIQSIPLPGFATNVDSRSDVDRPALTYSLTGPGGVALPSGLRFDPVNLILSGSPSVAGTTTLTYMAETEDEDDPDSASVTFDITVGEDLTPMPPAQTQAFTFMVGETINATNGTLMPFTVGNGELTYALLNTPALPNGLEASTEYLGLIGMIDADITGDQSVGIMTYTYTATDADGDRSFTTFTIRVVDALPQPPTAPQAFTFTPGETVSETLMPFTGGNGDLTYALVTTPALPTPLSFDADTREIAGILPADMNGDDNIAATTYTYTATDQGGDRAEVTFTIEVLDAMPQAPTVTNLAFLHNTTIPETVLPEFTTTTTDNPDLTYSLAGPDDGPLPTGLSFAANTRTLSGIPADPVTTTVTYSATDDVDVAMVTFDIIVSDDPVPIAPTIENGGFVFTPRQDLTLNPVTLPAFTGGFPPFTYRLSNTAGEISSTNPIVGGLTFTAADRTITGTVGDDAAGPTEYTYRTEDDNGDPATVTFTIEIQDSMPTPPAQQDLVFEAGLPLSEVFLDEFTDGDAPLTYALSTGTTLPWLTLNPSTRELTGTVPSDAAGPTEYTYMATDLDGDEGAAATFTIEITDAMPTFGSGTTIDTLTITLNSPYFLDLPKATSGSGELTYSLTGPSTNPSLPTGLEFDSESTSPTFLRLSGTPTGPAGTDTYTYQAQDVDGDADTRTFDITIVADLMPQAPTRTQAFTVEVGELVRETLDVFTGGNGDLTYALESNSVLPEGLRFEPDSREISGIIADTAGDQNAAATYTYMAIDEDGDREFATFTIAIVDALPVAPTQTQAFTLLAGDTQSRMVLLPITGGNGALAYEQLSPALPTGLSFNVNSLALTGAITDGAGDESAPLTTYTYSAMDQGGDSASATITITIVDARPMTLRLANRIFSANRQIEPVVLPSFTTTPDLNNFNPSFTHTLANSNGEEVNTGTFIAGLMYNADTRTIFGTPNTNVPVTTYTYTITDGADIATDTFTISVVDNSMPMVPTFTDGGYSFAVREAVSEVLPDFEGGDRPLTYTLSPPLPTGLTFTAANRTISGEVLGTAGNDAAGPTEYTYTVMESTRGNPTPDSAVATVTITITDAIPAFTGGETILPIAVAQGTAITTTLPAVETEGSGTTTYTLTGAGGVSLPTGLSFQNNPDRPNFRELSGTPTASLNETTFTYTATDDDGDTDELMFTITIQSTSDTAPMAPPITGGGYTFVAGQEIDPVILPAFTGGNAPIAYTLRDAAGELIDDDTNPLIGGLEYDQGSREISGTPDDDADNNSVAPTTYTYTATDSDTADDPDVVSTTFTITITDDYLLPPTVNHLSFSPGDTVSVTLNAFMGSSGAITHSLARSDDPNMVKITDLVGGLEFDPDDRTITGDIPADAGNIAATEYTYTGVADDTGETASTTFTITITDVPSLDMATASAIPTVGANIALVASQAISSRVELALNGLSSGIDISTLEGQQFRLNPSVQSNQQNGSSGSSVRFGVWYSAASDTLSDTRSTITWEGTTDTTNLGFDVGFDISESASLVVGILQNSSSTSATYRNTESSDDNASSTLSVDLDSTAFYVGLGYDWLDAWFANGSADSTLNDSETQLAIPASFSYQTIGLTAAFEVAESFNIGAKVESLTSDLSLTAIENDDRFNGLQTDSSQLRTAFVANYQLKLGEKGNGLLIPKLEFGLRDLSLGTNITDPAVAAVAAAGGSATETGFGIDYLQKAWGLTLGIDIRSISVENYTSDSTQWQIRWESGNYGSGLSFGLKPHAVSETLGGIDSLYSGDYNQYQSLLERQRGGNSTQDSKGVDFEVGYGIAAGYGTITPYLKTTNYRGSGNQAHELGIRYQTLGGLELSVTAERERTPQTTQLLGIPISFMQQEHALTFNTRYSF